MQYTAGENVLLFAENNNNVFFNMYIYLLFLAFCPCTQLSLLGELTVCFVTMGATASELGFIHWEGRESEQIMNHCKNKQTFFSLCGKSVPVKNVLFEEVFQRAVLAVSPHPWLWEPAEWLEQQQPGESSGSGPQWKVHSLLMLLLY